MAKKIAAIRKYCPEIGRQATQQTAQVVEAIAIGGNRRARMNYEG